MRFDCNECRNLGDENTCLMCVQGSKFYQVKKKSYGLKKNYNKQSKRMGSKAELINHQSNEGTVKASMTPNSGAGKVKGDEQIRGLVNIMQEVKTQEVTRARGHSQFTIKRDWLDKLAEEGQEANMDFWYLVFSFKDTDTQQYVIIDKQQMNDMVATIVDDRKVAQQANNRIDTANKRRVMVEAENTKLLAEIDYLKAKIKELEK